MKILITRTVPHKAFENILSNVIRKYPEGEIFILAQKSSISLFSPLALKQKHIVVSDGPFSLWGEGWRLIKSLRENRFDLMILTYNNREGKGYLHLDLLSLFSGIPKEIVFDKDGNCYPVPSRFIKIIKRIAYLPLGKLLQGIIYICLGMQKKNYKFKPGLSPGTNKHRRKIKGKKIVFVDLMFSWPPHGGACVDLKEVATRLFDRGYDVHLVVPDFKWKNKHFSQVNDGLFTRGDVNESLLPFRVHKVPFSLWTFNFFFLPGIIRRKVSELNPDYVYIGDSYFFKPYLINALLSYNVIARFYTYELLCLNRFVLGKDGKTCQVNFLHDPLSCSKCAVEGMHNDLFSLNWDLWSYEFVMSLAFFPNYHSKVIKALKQCHSLISYNELGQGLLKKVNPRSFSFPGGVNVSTFETSLGSANGNKKILFSGRLMDSKKGLDVFLKSVRKLREQRSDFIVYLTYDQKFTEDYIVPLGWVDHGKIKDIYKDMDICVVPSLWEEPFGIVAVEAMAAGKPVVASSVAGLKMSVQDGKTGLFFKPGDSDGLVRCLNKLLESPDLIKQMGAAGRKRAKEHFDWEHIVDRYVNEIFIG